MTEHRQHPRRTHGDSPGIREVLTEALKQLEDWELTIDWEFGDCRSLQELEDDGMLSKATILVRQALKEMES